MNIPCFYLKPTGTQRLWLRRFRSCARPEPVCPKGGYHQALNLIGDAAEKLTPEGYVDSVDPEVYADDPRWPARCECGYEFHITDDQWQVFTRTLYRREDTGEILTIEDAPAGAIWNAWWLGRYRESVQLMCKLPGDHHWHIDGRASNCDSPCANCAQPFHSCNCKRPQYYVDSRPHQCWVRHGEPPNLTVDKNGVTCGAGAGSIVVPGWHGFLRNGILVPC